MQQRHIIPVGGKMLVPSAPPVLEQYCISTSGIAEPEVCFIPTASGDDAGYIERFHQVYRALGARPKYLPLFARTPRDIAAYLLSSNIIHVGGGNTRSMIAVWKYWGVDEVLRTAWERGIVLTGSSAGMLCWFESGVTDALADSLSTCEGLGFLPGSACPHFDGESERRPAYEQMIRSGALSAGYAADDAAGLHFIGTTLHAALSAAAGAHVYSFARDEDGSLREHRLEALSLID